MSSNTIRTSAGNETLVLFLGDTYLKDFTRQTYDAQLSDIQWTVHRDVFAQYKPTRCTVSQNQHDKYLLRVYSVEILLMMDNGSVRNMQCTSSNKYEKQCISLAFIIRRRTTSLQYSKSKPSKRSKAGCFKFVTSEDTLISEKPCHHDTDDTSFETKD